MIDLEQRLAKLQKQFHGLKIMGGEGVTVHGSPGRGYVVDVKAGVAQSGTSTGPPPVEGCTDPEAINFNPSATIDDGSCEYATGACCYADLDNLCQVQTEADCVECCPAGVYQGDDTVCDPNPCVCPEITVDCDQICFSGKKCGWEGALNSGAPTDTFWRTAEANTDTLCFGSATGHMNAHSIVQGINPFLPTASFCDPSNEIEIECSGGGTCTCEFGTTSCDWCSNVCSPDDCGGSVNVNPAYTFRAGHVVSDTEFAFSVGELGPFPDTFGNTVMSEEETTSDLVVYIVDNLPAYDDSFIDDCTAKKIDEFGDNSRYTVCHFKPKFTFSVAPVDFNINYNEHFEPADMSSPSDTPKSVFVSTGETEVFGDEVMEPTDNGTITITDITTDCTLV